MSDQIYHLVSWVAILPHVSTLPLVYNRELEFQRILRSDNFCIVIWCLFYPITSDNAERSWFVFILFPCRDVCQLESYFFHLFTTDTIRLLLLRDERSVIAEYIFLTVFILISENFALWFGICVYDYMLLCCVYRWVRNGSEMEVGS